jgi:hypothetical protein
MLLSEQPMNFHAINNDEAPLSNGFDEDEKWNSISGGIFRERTDIGDASMVVGAGPISLDADADTVVAFSLMAAGDLPGLQRAAAAAREFFTRLGGTPGGPISLPVELRLATAQPNPFAESTSLELSLPESSHVQLDAYNARGEFVARILDQTLPRGTHAVRFTPETNEHAVYFLQLRALGRTVVQKVIRLQTP